MKNNNNNKKFDLTIGRRHGHEPLSLFDPFFDDFFDFPTFDRKEIRSLERVMKTDVKETEKNYVLDIEMPGFDKRDINIDLSNGYLTISAKREHKVDNENKKENFIRRERSYGQFSRSFYVGDIKKEDVEASLENGVLKVVLPKEEKHDGSQNRIEIK